MKSPLILTVLLALALCAPAKDKDKPKHERDSGMALKDGLAAAWLMDNDPAIFPIHDHAFPHANSLTGVNFNPALSPPGGLVDGKVGKAILFNGTTHHLFLESSAGFSHGGGPFTVASWIKPLTLKHQASVFTSDEWQVALETVGADTFFKVTIGGFADAPEDLIVTSVPLQVGEWYFLTFGWYDDNGSFARAAVMHSRAEAVRVARASFLPAILTFYIAAGFNSNFHGVIDDTFVWHRHVSAAELYQIWNKDKGLPFEDWDAVTSCKSSIECCD